MFGMFMSRNQSLYTLRIHTTDDNDGFIQLYFSIKLHMFTTQLFTQYIEDRPNFQSTE